MLLIDQWGDEKFCKTEPSRIKVLWSVFHSDNQKICESLNVLFQTIYNPILIGFNLDSVISLDDIYVHCNKRKKSTNDQYLLTTPSINYMNDWSVYIIIIIATYGDNVYDL